ncbi:hypothetical protein HGRIS_004181 [Hohenbuehelia grisea]|uniref:tRNA (guanine-N(7)-)-methyltransferase non-catalytic subunit TRM82 n=1 Tax=Hohenbuehelia grisea TaxID=104357 RepID=A0ABR3JHU9_9AGAR
MSVYPLSRLLLAGASKGAVISGPHFHILNLKTGEKSSSSITLEDAVKDAVVKSGPIRCAALSDDERYLATSGDDKKLKIWEIDGPRLLNERELPKKPTGIQWTKDGARILVSDKFGDVFSYTLEPNAEPVKKERDALSSHENPSGGDLILGHTSLLTSFVLSSDEKYIITADRDEHVRVSWYPKGFNIEMYCLGHTKFVSSIHVPKFSASTLISGGGDPMLKVWDWMSGSLLFEIPILDAVTPYIHVRPPKRKRGWDEGNDEEGTTSKGRRRRRGKGRAADPASSAATGPEAADENLLPDAAPDNAMDEASESAPNYQGRTTLVIHKIDSIESNDGNYLVFSAVGATAVFWCKYTDASTPYPVQAFDFGKPVIDFSISQTGHVWASLDGEWSSDSTNSDDRRMVRSLALTSGKLREISLGDASPILEALNGNCTVPAVAEDLKTLDLYSPLMALPKNPDAEHNAMDRDVTNIEADVPESSVVGEGQQSVSKKILGRLKNKKKLLDRVNAQGEEDDRDEQPELKRTRSETGDDSNAVTNDVEMAD